MFALAPWRKRGTAPVARTETPFSWLPEEFEKLFSWPLLADMPEMTFPWGMTLEEKDKEVVVRVELPGFEPAELKVELVGERLLVEAEHKEEPPEKGEKKPERAFAHVKRELTLPAGVLAEKAEATFRNGVLEVHLPRTPKATGRRIDVKT